MRPPRRTRLAIAWLLCVAGISLPDVAHAQNVCDAQGFDALLTAGQLDRVIDSLKLTTSADPQWGNEHVRDNGKLHFSKKGLYRITLGAEDLLDWPGAEIWNIELTPAW